MGYSQLARQHYQLHLLLLSAQKSKYVFPFSIFVLWSVFTQRIGLQIHFDCECEKMDDDNDKDDPHRMTCEFLRLISINNHDSTDCYLLMKYCPPQ